MQMTTETFNLSVRLTPAQLEAIDKTNALIAQILPGSPPRTHTHLLYQALFMGLHAMGIPLECPDEVLMLPVRLVDAPQIAETQSPAQSPAPTQRLRALSDIPADEVLERIHQALAVANDTELAARIKVPFNTIIQWRYRKTIPASAVVRLAVDYGLSLDWLYKGEGHPKRDATPT